MKKNLEILLLTDYNGVFGSKYNAQPYRSGYNLDLVKNYFSELGCTLTIQSFSDIDFASKSYKDTIVIYTSVEEDGGYYKSYVEDVVLGLELAGARLLPPFKYLKAHHNKVFMEIIRQQFDNDLINNLESFHFGSLDECLRYENKFSYPVVIKQPDNASSRGVYLAKNRDELINVVKRVSDTKMPLKWKMKEEVRERKHKGYKKESNYRRKFIVQQFIPGLEQDWKILGYGKRYYMVQRPVYKDGFASSGGDKKNMHFTHDATYPEGIYDFAEKVSSLFNFLPISIDVCFDGENFYLLEFQFLQFGTSGHSNSKCSMQKVDGKWQKVYEEIDLELVFAEAVSSYIFKEYPELK